MRNFQDTFETRKRLFISAFSICMTVPLRGVIIFTDAFFVNDRIQMGLTEFSFRMDLKKLHSFQMLFFF